MKLWQQRIICFFVALGFSLFVIAIGLSISYANAIAAKFGIVGSCIVIFTVFLALPEVDWKGDGL